VLVLEDPRRTAPDCASAADIGRPFGWTICVPPGAAGEAGESGTRTLVDTALREIEARAPGTVLSTGGVVLTAVDRYTEAASLRTGGTNRWPYALVLGGAATTAERNTSATGLRRAAFVQGGREVRGGAAREVAEALARAGVATTWFPASEWGRAREDSMRRALTWLFAGDEARVCRGGGPAPAPEVQAVALCKVPRVF
jgi:hypothetical protein